MKKLLPVVMLFVALSANAFAQSSPTLSVRPIFWGNQYEVNGNKVTFVEFKETLSSNPEAIKMVSSGRALATTGNIISFTGAFCFGYDLGTRLGGGDGNTAMLVAGGAAMVGGIIMSLCGESKIRKGITLYNDRVTTSDLRFGFTDSGIGICMKF